MSKFKLITLFGPLAFFGAIAVITSNTSLGQDGATSLNCDQPPCDAVARGRAAFKRRNLNQLGGNGRACADCHMPSESFQLSPAAAKSRFEAVQEKRKHNRNADDPLFRPVDADDFRVNGEKRERLFEPGGKRARARDDALAAEREAHRSRNGSTQRRDLG